MDKKHARSYMKEKRKHLSADEINLNSSLITEKLLELEEFKNSDNIFAYVSCNNEVSTFDLIKKCFTLGKNVFVPKVYGAEMKFHKITSLNELVKGSFNILEPDNNHVTDKNTGICIMPGLAFDKEFHRVGYGGGYYDKYLNKYSGLIKVAVCFEFQLLKNESITADSFDLKPDIIITEKRVYKRTY